jgi:hypothetical protein
MEVEMKPEVLTFDQVYQVVQRHEQEWRGVDGVISIGAVEGDPERAVLFSDSRFQGPHIVVAVLENRTVATPETIDGVVVVQVHMSAPEPQPG